LRDSGRCGWPRRLWQGRHRGDGGLAEFRRIVRFWRNRGSDSFGGEGLRNGLFASTACAATASATTPATTGAGCGFAGCGRVDGVRDLVGNIGGWRIRGRGVEGWSIHGRRRSRANGTRTGTGPGFRLRLRLAGGGRGRFPAAFFFCAGIGGRLLGVEICGLQGWRSRLVRRLGRLFLAALKTIAHPFTHVRLVTQMRRREQWFAVVSRGRVLNS
jgi:hypothetical protein